MFGLGNSCHLWGKGWQKTLLAYFVAVLLYLSFWCWGLDLDLIVSVARFTYSLYQSLFVCVEVLRPSQPNGIMSSAVSLPNHTFTGQA